MLFAQLKSGRAVDRDRLAGHPVTRLGGEEPYPVGDVQRLAEPPHGDPVHRPRVTQVNGVLIHPVHRGTITIERRRDRGADPVRDPVTTAVLPVNPRVMTSA